MARSSHAASTAAASFLLAWLLAVSAHAQPLAPGVGDPQFPFGRLGVSPAVILFTGYDSNLSREPGAPSSGPETFVVPQVHAWWRSGVVRVGGGAAAEFIKARDVDAKAELTGSPKSNKYSGASVEVLGSHVQVSSVVSLKHTNARVTGFEIGARSVRVEKEFRADATFRLTERGSVNASLSMLRTTWDADEIYAGSALERNLNSRFTRREIGFGYRLTRITRVFAGVDFNTQTFFLAPQRDNLSRTIQGGVSMAPRGLFAGAASVGYRGAQQPADDGSDISGLVAHGNLTHTRPSGALISVAFVQEKLPSYDLNQRQYRLRGFDVLGNGTVFRRWSAFGTFGFHRLAYEQPVIRLEQHLTYGAGVTIRPRQRLRVGVTAERYQHTALFGRGQQYKGFMTGVFLVYGSRLVRPLDRPLPPG